MKRSISLFMAIIMVLSLTLALPQAALAADAIDRAAVVQRLYELEGQPMVIQSVVFPDAAGSAATWAYGAGIVRGDGDGLFHGDRTVTRAELVTMLYRYAQYKGIDVSVGENTNILSYNDAFDLPAWCIPAFQWVCGAGIIEDVDGYLLPDSAVTTEELAAFLSKLGNSADPLSLWTDDAALKTELTAYMAAITDPASRDYIPVPDRIAVFDMDGTVFCETDPVYFDHMLFLYRVTQDPDYKDKASEVEKEVAEKIQKEFIENGTYPAGMDVAHGQGVASAFAGMTLDQFDAYVQAFKQLPMPSYAGMTQGEAFYRPMVQMIEYLQANDFKVYIISGTDRLIVRALFKDNILDIPSSQLIGSDELLVASHQGDTDGLDYTFEEGDEIILGGEFLIKNLKMNKVTAIAREIGQQPVLSFGNSSGDGAMANYVIHDNPHRALAFMLCCDDTVRENGSQSKADKMYDLCEKNGWILVSMRDDWTTIYGDGVTYLGAAGDVLSEIKARGVLRVGTTGDYRPMSFLDPETGEYWGFDAELAEDLAAALGVETEYVPTTWPTLMDDTLAGKFDLAICGITVTEARREQALMSDGYLGNGKTVLCRAEDAEKYISLEAINRPEVTVMENPGGLNEKFAREKLPDATLVIHDVNEEIPGLVAAGEADVMITEILEAGWYVGQDSRLSAPLIYEPFTRGQLGVLMPKGSEALRDYVNAFLASEKASGRIDALAREYIYQFIDGAADAAA